jgi:hypothetical protein
MERRVKDVLIISFLAAFFPVDTFLSRNSRCIYICYKGVGELIGMDRNSRHEVSIHFAVDLIRIYNYELEAISKFDISGIDNRHQIEIINSINMFFYYLRIHYVIGSYWDGAGSLEILQDAAYKETRYRKLYGSRGTRTVVSYKGHILFDEYYSSAKGPIFHEAFTVFIFQFLVNGATIREIKRNLKRLS